MMELRDEQGWTDETLGSLALRFISASGKEKEFDRYLERVAEDENQMCMEDEESWEGPGVVEVEYDLEYRGGDYTAIGEILLVPVATIRECGGSVEEAFRELTGHNPRHIVHYSNREVPGGDC